jgi:predicted  nucleic acid-binding Zn-ribbon protein
VKPLKTLLQKETTKWQSKFNTISASLNETTTKLEDAKNKLSKYNIRNVNKKHKRLNEKCSSSDILMLCSEISFFST